MLIPGFPQVRCKKSQKSRSNEAATFGYLRVRVFAQRVREDLWLSASAPLLTAGGGLGVAMRGREVCSLAMTDFARRFSALQPIGNGRALSPARKYGHMPLAP
jgi:hypothetical protein